MSDKGGVGETSVSVNLSIALANKGYRVGLMDVDIHGPDIHRMHRPLLLLHPRKWPWQISANPSVFDHLHFFKV